MKIPNIFNDFTGKQRKISFVICISISIVIILFILIFNFISVYGFEKQFEENPLSFLDNLIIDHFFKRRFYSSDELPVSRMILNDIKIVKIDEYSLGSEEFPKWPIPRSRYGELIQKLNRAGAKTIGLDIIMPEKSTTEEDETLAFLLQGVTDVFFPIYFSTSTENISQDHRGIDSEEEDLKTIVKYPYKPFYDAILSSVKEGDNRFGFVAVNIEDVVRFMSLSHRYQKKNFYALPLLMAAHFSDIPQEELVNKSDEGYFMMGNTKIPLFKGRMMINYMFPPGEMTFNIGKSHNIRYFIEEFPIKDVFTMSDSTLKSIFEGKLVIVGATAIAAQDIKPTPFGAIPGVYSHANLITSLLGKKFIHPVSTTLNFVLIILAGIIIGLSIPMLSPWAGGIFTFLLCYGYYQFTYWNFSARGAVMFVAAPIAAALISFTAVNIYSLVAQIQARAHISKMFKEFAPLPSPLVEKYVEDFGGSAAVGGKLEHLSILFADIRGYTKMSESLSSQEVMDLLNEYHQAMGEVFSETGGVIFTYIGDAQLVVYGLEGISKVNHAAAAIKAGLLMQERLDQLKGKWEKEDKKIFEVGVGICTGELSIGVVGSKHLKQYTVIGDTVNVASRIQGMSRELASPTLIHERTYLMSRHCIDAEALRPVKLKGKQELVNVYRAKRVNEITPYPGDQIKDLDKDVAELHRKRDEALAKMKSKADTATQGREARRDAAKKRRIRDSRPDESKSEEAKPEETKAKEPETSGGDLEFCLLEPLEEQAKGEVADVEEEKQ